MAYGMEQLRKAGRAISDFDRAYAQKLGERIDPHTQPFREMTQAVPLSDIYKGIEADSQVENVLGHVAATGVGAANAAVRYALPAGGVTLAGVALMELAEQFGGPADQPEPMQLTM